MNKLAVIETKKAVPYTITSKRIKYLGTNSTKEVKDLYAENYKTLMWLRKTQKNGKILSAHELEDLILCKCPFLPKAIYRLSVIPTKIPASFFIENE